MINPPIGGMTASGVGGAQPHRARLRDRAVTETGVMFEAE